MLMDAQGWIRGYRQLLTYRAAGYPHRTLERYWMYASFALLLAMILIAAMVWVASRSSTSRAKPTPALRTGKIAVNRSSRGLNP